MRTRIQLPSTQGTLRVWLALVISIGAMTWHRVVVSGETTPPRAAPRAAPVGTEGNYAGTVSGDDQGIFNVTVTADGQMFGLAFSVEDRANDAILGTVQPDGTITFGVTSTASTFSGSINASGRVTGTWTALTGESGTFQGERTFIAPSDVAGDYEGTTKGLASGTWAVTIANTGEITGTGVVGGLPITLSGLASGKQDILGTDSDGGIFKGRFLMDGTARGNVFDVFTGEKTNTFSGKRVTPKAPPMQALFTATPSEGPAPLTTTFDATGSLIPAGNTPTAYRWNFGDGNTLTTTTPSTTHTYTNPGIFTATLAIDTDTGLSSPPAHQPILIGQGGIDDTYAYLSKANLNVNFAKHAKGQPSDQIKVSGYINPAGLPADLSGANIRLTINDVAAAPPTAVRTSRRAASRAAEGGASFVPLLKSNGAFAFTLKGKDVRTFFDVENASSQQTARTEFQIEISGVTVDNPIARGVIETPMKAKQNAAAKGVFSHIKIGSRTGVFKSLKTAASRGKTGYKVIATGPIEGEFSASLEPTGDITIILGGDGTPSTGETITVPLTALLVKGAGPKSVINYSKKLEEVAGLLKFQINNAKRKYVLASAELTATGIPEAGAGGNDFPLRIEIRVPTAAGIQTLLTTVEIKRTSVSSTKWKR